MSIPQKPKAPPNRQWPSKETRNTQGDVQVFYSLILFPCIFAIIMLISYVSVLGGFK